MSIEINDDSGVITFTVYGSAPSYSPSFQVQLEAQVIDHSLTDAEIWDFANRFLASDIVTSRVPDAQVIDIIQGQSVRQVLAPE